MQKYDDFAMPSLENIENMAKAYTRMEKEYLKDKQYKSVDENTIQKVYENIYNSYNILVKLCDICPKNRKFFILCEQLGKMKINFESDFVQNKLLPPTSIYTFTESSISYDLINVWCDCILMLEKYMDNSTIKNYLIGMIKLIKEIVKY